MDNIDQTRIFCNYVYESYFSHRKAADKSQFFFIILTQQIMNKVKSSEYKGIIFKKKAKQNSQAVQAVSLSYNTFSLSPSGYYSKVS